jgi:protein gp37
MNRTGIEYLDFTSNPIVGCDMSLPCAERCWARRMARRLRSAGIKQYQDVVDREGNWTGKTAFNQTALEELLHRRQPAVIGLGFMGDVFHESVPDEWLDRMFAVMALCPQHRFIMLTKRAQRMKVYVGNVASNRLSDWADLLTGPAAITAYAKALGTYRWPLPNLILGVSCEDQERADEQIPDLLATPAAMRFVSLEPLLGEVCLRDYLSDPEPCDGCGGTHMLSSEQCDREPDMPMQFRGLDWVIIGGESGPGARPMHREWVRSIRDQCVAAGVPFLFKQWGEWMPVNLHGISHQRVGKKGAGRMLDGKLWDQRPEGWG